MVFGEKSDGPQEAGDLPEIRTPVEMQQVAAGEPVHAAVVPVLPEQSTVLGRRQTVPDPSDDHAALWGQQGGVGQWTARGVEAPELRDGDAGGLEKRPCGRAHGTPLQHEIDEAGDGDVGNRKGDPLLDAGHEGGSVSPQADPGDADRGNAALVEEVMDEGADIEHGLGERLVGPAEALGEEPMP